MTGWRLAIALGLVLAVGGVGAADAKPKVSTRFSYYKLTAVSDAQLYAEMYRVGPKLAGNKAFAVTTMRPEVTWRTAMTGGACRVVDHTIALRFDVRLPRHSRAAALPGAVRKRWASFEGFVKAHEARHREIWLGCAREAERRMRALSRTTCAGVDQAIATIFAEASAACEPQHDAFDAADQARLAKHPLVVAARRAKGKVAAARPAAGTAALARPLTQPAPAGRN